MGAEPMRVLSTAELREAGFETGIAGSILAYVTCGFDDAAHHETAVAALASISVKHEERRSSRHPEVWLRIGPVEGEGIHQDALFAGLLAEFTMAVAAWERAGVAPGFVKLVVVQYLAPTYQGHGLGLSKDWIQALARWGAELDVDQYVVVGE